MINKEISELYIRFCIVEFSIKRKHSIEKYTELDFIINLSMKYITQM